MERQTLTSVVPLCAILMSSRPGQYFVSFSHGTLSWVLWTPPIPLMLGISQIPRSLDRDNTFYSDSVLTSPTITRNL